MRDYLRIAFDRIPISADTRKPITRLAQKCISLPARWRLDHDFYAFPFELGIKNAANKWFAPPKPKVESFASSTAWSASRARITAARIPRAPKSGPALMPIETLVMAVEPAEPEIEPVSPRTFAPESPH